MDTTAPHTAAPHSAALQGPAQAPQPFRMLGVWAHPDDEAYLSAALMARVVDAGGSVTVVTATLGEQGSADPALAGTAAFGSQREGELRRCLAELGVTDLRVLGVPDGGCPEADAEQQVAAIAAVIDEVDPEVVVTFGPDGMTWHPDHQAVSAWTTQAWARTGATADLLYASMTEEFASTHQALHERIGLFADWGPGHAATIPLAEVALEAAMTPAELARKRRALGHHASQIDGVVAAFGEASYLQWLHQETYRRPAEADLVTGATR
jgi:LmbE family N-acetylglucosaminyl deacetylase